jgi:hypothetical protein
MNNPFSHLNRVNITSSLAVIIGTNVCRILNEHIEGFVNFTVEGRSFTHEFTYYFNGDKQLLSEITRCKETKDWLQCEIIKGIMEHLHTVVGPTVTKAVVSFSPDIKPFGSILP